MLQRPEFRRRVDHEAVDPFQLARRAPALPIVPPVAVGNCRNAKDNKVLELALATEAGILVASDDDLLVLHPWRGIEILAPAAFVMRSGRRGATRRRARAGSLGVSGKERRAMPTGVKEMMAEANAAVPRIGPAEVKAMAGDPKLLLVDVRDSAEVAASGKAKGAVHVTRGLIEFRADPDSPSHDPAFDRGKTVVLYCASGGRSALAGKTLKDMGYADVRNLGAFKDWVEAGGEVER